MELRTSGGVSNCHPSTEEGGGKRTINFPEYPVPYRPLGLGGICGIDKRYVDQELLATFNGSKAGDGGACAEGFFPHYPPGEAMAGRQTGDRS